MAKPQFEVTVQYRSQKTYVLRADDKAAAIEKAAQMANNEGVETIAFSATPTGK